MAAVGKLGYYYLAWFAKPASDRRLYRMVRRNGVRQVVEFGVDSLDRTIRMLRLAERATPPSEIQYTGFDWFEERPADAESLRLIDAHRRLNATGVRVRLAPGGPTSALPGLANELSGADLILISGQVSDEQMAPVWFYLPRMTQGGASVLRFVASETGEGAWREVTPEEISANAAPVRRAA